MNLGKLHYLLKPWFSLFNENVELGRLQDPFWSWCFLNHNRLWSKGLRQVPWSIVADWWQNAMVDLRITEERWRVWGKGRERAHKSIECRDRSLEDWRISGLSLLPASAPHQYSGMFQSPERSDHAPATNWSQNLNGLTQAKFVSCS